MSRSTLIPFVVGCAITAAAGAGGPVITEYEQSADLWLAATQGEEEAVAFDQFVPGGSGESCLATAPVTIPLVGGTVTASAFNSLGLPDCVVYDGSGPDYSDGYMRGTPNPVTLRLEFDPGASAFFGFYSSLADGAVVTTRLFAGESQVGELVGATPDPPTFEAIGHGFTADGILIDRIEFSTSDDDGNGITLLGAFGALLPGEPSLGQVVIPGYSGPTGESVEYDFAVVFGQGPDFSCLAADVSDDGAVGITDLLLLLASWGPCLAPPALCFDIDGSGAVDVVDLLELLANWGPCF